MPNASRRISLAEDFEVRTWASRMGVSVEQLRAAVDRVGYDVDNVRRDLEAGRERWAEPTSFAPNGGGRTMASSTAIPAPLMPDPRRFADRQAHAQSMEF